MLSTGEGALKLSDWVTDDGLQAVFQTNLFGHYVLVCWMFWKFYIFLMQKIWLN